MTVFDKAMRFPTCERDDLAGNLTSCIFKSNFSMDPTKRLTANNICRYD